MRIASTEEIKEELRRVSFKSRFLTLLRSTIYILIIIAACAILAAILFFPVFRVYSASMNPTLKDGQIIAAIKNAEIRRGDIVGFYYGNKLLIKRCIALEGDSVFIDLDGNVFVNDEYQQELYLDPESKSYGKLTDIKMPYEVPANSIFVLGDSRKDFVDSRAAAMGPVDLENVAGRMFLRVWPLKEITFFGPQI